MTDRPILFSAPMVRALFDGKTQTRRVLKPQPDGWVRAIDRDVFHGWRRHDNEGYYETFSPPYAVGDRLWVRETFRQAYPATSYSPGIVYRADKARSLGMDEYSDRHKWMPSIFLPRTMSRLTLTVTDVRVQRVQSIASADAIAEGCPAHANSLTIDCDTPDPRDDYKRIWDSLNAKRAPWASNPWVVALTFSVAHQNIDHQAPS